MRYYGDFRSTDTSVDTKGQLYRVLLFTNYNGTNPYPYQQYSTLPTGNGYTLAPITFPQQGTRLTLSDSPFVVTYEGDDNIFKPYRASRAEVSFLMSNINLDFVNGTKTLVILLRWKNEVQQQGNYMLNTLTGERLNKTQITDRGATIDGTPFYLFNDFEPYRYDKFCYDVEWIGFSTPETFTMGYDHTRDKFTLNCLDAFSALQYRKYKWLGNEDTFVVPMLNVLFMLVGSLGTYSKIYITDTIRFADQVGTALKDVCIQQQNFFDEDNEPTDQRSVIEEILKYMGLTAIPYQDKLIITTPTAIADGWSNYNVYTLPASGYVMNWGGGLYYQQSDEYLSHAHIIGNQSHAGSTTIGTKNVYNAATLQCDEYDVEMILPDIGDNDNLTAGTYELTNNYFFPTGNTRVDWCWEHQFYNSAVKELKLYQYEGSNYSNGWGTAEVETPTYAVNATLRRRPFAAVLDDGGFTKKTLVETMKRPYSPTRKIYFNTPSVASSVRGNFDNKEQYWQPLLYAKSKDVVINSNQYLQITGTWNFFSSANDALRIIPDNSYISSTLQDANRENQYCFIHTKVRCCGKWLKNTSAGYGWQNDECFVKLYLETDSSKKAFGTSVAFARTMRNFSGIIVPLPIHGDNASAGCVEIWIDRPLGVSQYLCCTATLDDFEFNIYSADYIANRGNVDNSNTNTEYRAEMDSEAVEEFPSLSSVFSSDKNKGARYSQVVRSTSAGMVVMPNVYNVSNGNYHCPEQHVVETIALQYTTPTIALQMALHNNILPYSVLSWNFTDNRKFIVNGMSIDYELNVADCDLQEVKTTTQTITTTIANRTRNYHRNGDLISNERQARVQRLPIADTLPTATALRTISGHTLTTTDEREGNITLQPQLGGTNRMLVSFPNDIAGGASASNGHLILTINN